MPAPFSLEELVRATIRPFLRLEALGLLIAPPNDLLSPASGPGYAGTEMMATHSFQC
jgi:hypothetical protein